MSDFEVRLRFGVDAEDTDAAAEAFGDYLGMSKTVEVEVIDAAGIVTPVEVQL
jgi:hypothetical protein